MEFGGEGVELVERECFCRLICVWFGFQMVDDDVSEFMSILLIEPVELFACFVLDLV